MIKDALNDFIKKYPAHTSGDLQSFILGFKECQKILIPDSDIEVDGEFLSSQDCLKIALFSVCKINLSLESCENVLKAYSFLNSNSSVNLSIEQINKYTNEIKRCN
jgi:hypothetical protein